MAGERPARFAAFNVVLRGVGAETGAQIIDLGDRLCPGGQYRANADGVPLRGDGVHVSAGGAQWLLPWLLPQLRA